MLGFCRILILLELAMRAYANLFARMRGRAGGRAPGGGAGRISIVGQAVRFPSLEASFELAKWLLLVKIAATPAAR